MTTVALNNLWTYIDSLNLSRKNRQWLSDKLTASTSETKKVNELDLALEDVKKGNVMSFDDVDDAIAYLNS